MRAVVFASVMLLEEPANTVTFVILSAVLSASSYWPLDTQAGVTTPDVVGGLTGTRTSGVSLIPDGGHWGGALSFPGTSSERVSVGDVYSFANRSPFTVAAWVNVRLYGDAYPRVIAKVGGTPTNTQGWEIVIHDGSMWTNYGFGCARRVDHGVQNAVDSRGGLVPLNVWQHVACTFDGSTIRLYVGGALVASQADARNLKETGAGLSFGANSPNAESPTLASLSPFAGLIDEVRIFDVPLNDAEVIVLSTTGPYTPDAGMPDAGMPDAGMPDAGMPDAGMPDAGMPDAGVQGAGALDAKVGCGCQGGVAPWWLGVVAGWGLWRRRRPPRTV